MSNRRPDEITIFASSHIHHPMATAIRQIDGGPFSHAGLRITAGTTFEARFRVGRYPFQNYQSGEYRFAEWRLKGISDDRKMQAFIATAERYDGAYYPVAQILSMIPWALWRRAGVDRAISFTRGLICSELVWYYLRTLASRHFDHVWERCPDENKFTPNKLVAVCDEKPSLFERLR